MLRVFKAGIWRALLFGLGAWSALVALLSPALPFDWRLPCSIVMALIMLAALCKPRIFIIPTLIGISLTIYLWSQLTPSTDKDWKPEVARLPWAERNGDEITIHNVRDFKYRSDTDFDPNYVTKKVRLSELSSLDLFASYWAGKDIAHIFISFGFANSDYLTFSVEVRSSKSQEYSTTAGFFRNFELIYVVAEERDVIGLRTKFRQPNEQVHLLRLAYYPPYLEKLFLSYMDRINSLAQKPEFYNTLTTNCTTQVLSNAQAGERKFSYDWRLLLSGHTPEWLYDIKNLDLNYSLSELMEKGLINPRAQDVSDAARFSQEIRTGVPKPQPFSAPPQ